MPKITAWKCPHTGKLFDDEGVYKRHLKTLSRLRCRAREHQLVVDSVDAVMTAGRECKNAQELCEYILKHSKEYMLTGMWRSFNGSAINEALKLGHQIHWPKFTGIKFHHVRWNDKLSNTHAAPRGKKTNWGGNEIGVSRGYPGWGGNIRVYHKPNAKIVIVDPRKTRVREFSIPSFSNCAGPHSGINTGTGGGRADGFYYDVKLFAEDFPEMEKQVIFHTLGGRVAKDSSWNSPSYSVLNDIGEGQAGKIPDDDS